MNQLLVLIALRPKASALCSTVCRAQKARPYWPQFIHQAQRHSSTSTDLFWCAMASLFTRAMPRVQCSTLGWLTDPFLGLPIPPISSWKFCQFATQKHQRMRKTSKNWPGIIVCCCRLQLTQKTSLLSSQFLLIGKKVTTEWLQHASN